jgi:Brp/Blh family beta-carotene 15,15'-monooxygenase
MGSNSHRWLEPALRWQSMSASFAIAGFVAIAALGLHFSLFVQFSILLAGIVLVGFPHGAFDHLVARPVLAPRLGRFWWGVFGLSYIGLAGLVWLVWVLAPLPTLVLFLAGSILHFGLGDTEERPCAISVPRWVLVIIYGALPIFLPIAFHPAQAAPWLAAIGDVAEPTMIAALSHLIWLAPLWGGAFVWICCTGRQPPVDVMGLVVTAIGFVVLPPLLAFGLYFGLVHSPRHLLRLGAWYDPRSFQRAARWATRILVPASFVCVLGLAALALTVSDQAAGFLVPTFRIIAALTLPHMVVTSWLAERRD